MSRVSNTVVLLRVCRTLASYSAVGLNTAWRWEALWCFHSASWSRVYRTQWKQRMVSHIHVSLGARLLAPQSANCQKQPSYEREKTALTRALTLFVFFTRFNTNMRTSSKLSERNAGQLIHWTVMGRKCRLKACIWLHNQFSLINVFIYIGYACVKYTRL